MKNEITEILNEILTKQAVSVDVSKMKYEWDEIADIEPLMDNSDYEMLLNDVKLIGKIHTPVIIYRGKIVDGRHRQRVAIQLNLSLPIINISDSYNKINVREAIRSLSMKRNKSKTQKEIQAFRYKQLIKSISWKEAASRYGVTERSVKRINSLFNALRENGFESDFDKILAKFEYGMNVNPKDFEWLDRVTGTPYGCLTQLKDYKLRIQYKDTEDLGEVDITEINHTTGEAIRKEENPFIITIEDENKKLKEELKQKDNEIGELKSMVKTLMKEVKELRRQIKSYKEELEEDKYIQTMVKDAENFNPAEL